MPRHPQYSSPYWDGRLGSERHKLEAFQAGYTAYENNQEVRDNPHDCGTELWEQWDKGWHQAEKDALENPND